MAIENAHRSSVSLRLNAGALECPNRRQKYGKNIKCSKGIIIDTFAFLSYFYFRQKCCDRLYFCKGADYRAGHADSYNEGANYFAD